MNIEKLQQMNELIQRDLKQLEDKNGELSQIIKIIQMKIYLYSIYNSIFRKDVHAYKKLLSLTAEFIPKIALPNNSFSYSQIIENLIFDGYFSSDTLLIPYVRKDNTDELDLDGFKGIDVVRREGVCRHFAMLHHDIFHKLHFSGNPYFCYSFYDNEILNPPINDKHNFLAINHAVNLIEFNGQYYIHDVYNKQYFYFINSFTAQLYKGNGNKFLCFSPVVNKMFSTKSYLQILEQILSFKKSSLMPHIDNNELNDIINETNQRFYNSTALLNDLRKDISPYVKKINGNTQEEKNR